MPTRGLDAKHIVNDLSRYEAARSGFFTLLIDKKINGINLPGIDPESAGDEDVISAQAREVLKLNVVKAPVPHFSIKAESFRRGNDVVKYAGLPDFKDGNIVVDDIVGVDTKSILMAWQALAYNVNTRKGGRMKDYKIDCQLIEYTQDYVQVRSWDLFGCWISDIQEGDFDKENDGKRQLTAKIEYDRAEMRIGDEIKAHK